MDKEILKLLPQKAFKLLSIKETYKVGVAVTKSVLDKQSYEGSFKSREENWRFNDVILVKEIDSSKKSVLTKADGEKILKIYFSQFFETNLPVHIDLRQSSFISNGEFSWVPSKIHYSFSPVFLEGVCLLYKGFYFNDTEKFEKGLVQLGMMKDSMTDIQRLEVKELFYKHFGEGKSEDVMFSLQKLQDSFNTIFSYFLKEDIPLNPEFAILGVCLVTLYLTLQDIPHALSVSSVFSEVANKYQK